VVAGDSKEPAADVSLMVAFGAGFVRKATRRALRSGRLASAIARRDFRHRRREQGAPVSSAPDTVAAAISRIGVPTTSADAARFSGGSGRMRRRSLLADPSTPAYRTVWNLGAGTAAHRCVRSESGAASSQRLYCYYSPTASRTQRLMLTSTIARFPQPTHTTKGVQYEGMSLAHQRVDNRALYGRYGRLEWRRLLRRC
jgi:hypothetical protein